MFNRQPSGSSQPLVKRAPTWGRRHSEGSFLHGKACGLPISCYWGIRGQLTDCWVGWLVGWLLGWLVTWWVRGWVGCRFECLVSLFLLFFCLVLGVYCLVTLVEQLMDFFKTLFAPGFICDILIGWRWSGDWWPTTLSLCLVFILFPACCYFNFLPRTPCCGGCLKLTRDIYFGNCLLWRLSKANQRHLFWELSIVEAI